MFIYVDNPEMKLILKEAINLASSIYVRTNVLRLDRSEKKATYCLKFNKFVEIKHKLVFIYLYTYVVYILHFYIYLHIIYVYFITVHNIISQYCV